MDTPRLARLLALLGMTIALTLGIASPAVAEDGLATTPEPASTVAGTRAGNLLSTSSSPLANGESVSHDLYWAGESLTLGSAAVNGDVIAAGRSLSLDGTTVGGSIRTASQDLSLKGVTATNLTCAGQTLAIDKTTTVNAAYLAGQTVTFSGTASDVAVSAQDVTIDGTVTGDVSISAKTVTVGPDTNISGTLSINAASEPTIPSSAKVGSVEFTQTENDSKDAAQGAVAAIFGLSLLKILYGIISGCVMALLLTLVLPKAVDGSAAMVRTRTAALLVSGLVGVLVIVPAFVILLALVATMPLAFALLLAFIALCLVAVPFAAASLTRLVFPGWNRFGAAAAGGAVLGLAAAIPVLGAIVSFAAVAYLLGYVIQCIWAGIQAPSAMEQEAAERGALPEQAAAESGAPVPPQGIPGSDDTPES